MSCIGGGRVVWGGGGGWQAGGGQKLPLGCIETSRSLSRRQICTQPTGWVETDIVSSQFDTTPTLISAPQWPHRPCNAPMRLYTVGKKPSVKADLAMYSRTVDVSR